MARDFNGSSQYIDCGDISAWGGLTKFSLGGFFTADALTDYAGLATQSAGGTSSIGIALGGSFDGGSNDLLVVVRDSADIYGYATGNLIAINTLYHALLVFDGSLSGNANRLKLYLNGVQRSLTFIFVSSPTVGAATPNVASNVRLGHFNGNAYFDGKLSEWAAYGDALTADQAAMLAAGFSPPLVRPDALLNYWAMRNGDGDRDGWGQANGTAANSPGYAQHPPIVDEGGITIVVTSAGAAPIIAESPVGLLRFAAPSLSAAKSAAPPVSRIVLTPTAPVAAKTTTAPIGLLDVVSITPHTIKVASPPIALVELVGLAPQSNQVAESTIGQVELIGLTPGTAKAAALAPVAIDFVTPTPTAAKQVSTPVGLLDLTAPAIAAHKAAPTSVGRIALHGLAAESSQVATSPMGVMEFVAPAIGASKAAGLSPGVVEFVGLVPSMAKAAVSPAGLITFVGAALVDEELPGLADEGRRWVLNPRSSTWQAIVVSSVWIPNPRDSRWS